MVGFVPSILVTINYGVFEMQTYLNIKIEMEAHYKARCLQEREQVQLVAKAMLCVTCSLVKLP